MQRQNFVKNEWYPHIVYEEKAKAARFGHEEFVETAICEQLSAAEMEG